MQNVNICFLVLELNIENIKLILATVIYAVLMTKAILLPWRKCITLVLEVLPDVSPKDDSYCKACFDKLH